MVKIHCACVSLICFAFVLFLFFFDETAFSAEPLDRFVFFIFVLLCFVVKNMPTFSLI